MTNNQALQIAPYLVNYFARQDQAKRFTIPGLMTREITNYYFTQQRILLEIIFLKQQISQAQELTDPIQAAAKLIELTAKMKKLEALTDGNL